MAMEGDRVPRRKPRPESVQQRVLAIGVGPDVAGGGRGFRRLQDQAKMAKAVALATLRGGDPSTGRRAMLYGVLGPHVRDGGLHGDRPTPPHGAHDVTGMSQARHADEAPEAVLFDRDGTLVVNVPYNGDPARVHLMPGAREAVELIRSAGLRLGVVSNQSGIARGLITPADVDAVNRRIDELLGAFETWEVCPHGPDDGCECRKPAPGLVLRAAATLGVEPTHCVLIGDTGADVEAALAVGARAILVPSAETKTEEIDAASQTAPDLLAAARDVIRLAGA